MNHVVDRELRREKGKVYTCFVDLKAAFDRVDGKILEKRLKEIGVSNRLKERVMELYMETRNKVKGKKKSSGEFWMATGVRQGCPLSLTLFNIYIANLEMELRRGQVGGVSRKQEDMATFIRGRHCIDGTK